MNPDELARLEDERDHLLRSLDDLDAEHDAGDLTDEEYEGLRDEYTNRAAEVLKAIEGQRDAMVAARPPRSATRIAFRCSSVVAVAVHRRGAAGPIAGRPGQRHRDHRNGAARCAIGSPSASACSGRRRRR